MKIQTIKTSHNRNSRLFPCSFLVVSDFKEAFQISFTQSESCPLDSFAGIFTQLRAISG